MNQDHYQSLGFRFLWRELSLTWWSPIEVLSLAVLLSVHNEKGRQGIFAHQDSPVLASDVFKAGTSVIVAPQGTVSKHVNNGQDYQLKLS